MDPVSVTRAPSTGLLVASSRTRPVMLSKVPDRPELTIPREVCCIGPLCAQRGSASSADAARTSRKEKPKTGRGGIRPPFPLPDDIAASIPLFRPASTGKVFACNRKRTPAPIKNREAFRPLVPLEGEPEGEAEQTAHRAVLVRNAEGVAAVLLFRR